jgi:hypothetical protein
MEAIRAGGKSSIEPSAWMLIWTTWDMGWDLYGICMGSVWDLYGICMGSVWDLYGMGSAWRLI